MKELKFLKDLPIKLTNENKRVVNVIGGDIYYDVNGNRYGYITFNNLSKSPVFSIQLFIREYSIEGKFIKDTEYFEPYTYYPHGNFVINEPIILDKETEAIEVTIVKITLNSQNFINDRLVGFKNEDYVDLYQKKAPIKKPGTAASFSFVANTSEQNVNVSNDLEQLGDEQVNEEQQSAINIEKESGPAEIKQFAKPQKNFWKFIYPVVGVAVLVILMFVIMITVTAGVDAFNNL